MPLFTSVIFDRTGWNGTGQCPMVKTIDWEQANPVTSTTTNPALAIQCTSGVSQALADAKAQLEADDINTIRGTDRCISGNPNQQPPQF